MTLEIITNIKQGDPRINQYAMYLIWSDRRIPTLKSGAAVVDGRMCQNESLRALSLNAIFKEAVEPLPDGWVRVNEGDPLPYCSGELLATDNLDIETVRVYIAESLQRASDSLRQNGQTTLAYRDARDIPNPLEET